MKSSPSVQAPKTTASFWSHCSAVLKEKSRILATSTSPLPVPLKASLMP